MLMFLAWGEGRTRRRCVCVCVGGGGGGQHSITAPRITCFRLGNLVASLAVWDGHDLVVT